MCALIGALVTGGILQRSDRPARRDDTPVVAHGDGIEVRAGELARMFRVLPPSFREEASLSRDVSR
ncbi:MAG TPA: hypothetical protein VGO62_16940, partial [Myxococcota bacterium]